MRRHESECLSVVVASKTGRRQSLLSVIQVLHAVVTAMQTWKDHIHGKVPKSVEQWQSREARFRDRVSHIRNQSQMGDIDRLWEAC